jgi:hypothetical protein
MEMHMGFQIQLFTKSLMAELTEYGNSKIPQGISYNDNENYRIIRRDFALKFCQELKEGQCNKLTYEPRSQELYDLLYNLHSQLNNSKKELKEELEGGPLKTYGRIIDANLAKLWQEIEKHPDHNKYHIDIVQTSPSCKFNCMFPFLFKDNYHKENESVQNNQPSVNSLQYDR